MVSWRTSRQDAQYRVREAKTQIRQIDSQLSGLRRSVAEAEAKRSSWALELEAAEVSLEQVDDD